MFFEPERRYAHQRSLRAPQYIYQAHQWLSLLKITLQPLIFP
jgi:hypothetical protein